jgi:hypothetical protein
MRLQPLAFLLVAPLFLGCTATETPIDTETGGTTGTGGKAAGTGGLAATGGALTSSGGTVANTGGFSTGGAATGGTAIATGGKAAGGTGTGGASAGGGPTGGTATGGANTGGTATGGKSTGGTPTGGAATGGRSTGGAATGGSGTCSPTWDPPATANGNTNIPAGLTQVWDHSGSTIMAASNIKIYQIMKNNGSLNYCVRWQSSTQITATDRQQMATLIGKCDKQWTDKLTGWGCWPYSDVTVKVVLWAVTNASVLAGWSDSEGKMVVNSDASCPSDCGPWAPNKSFSNCSTALYDEFFWLDGTLRLYGLGLGDRLLYGCEFFPDRREKERQHRDHRRARNGPWPRAG